MRISRVIFRQEAEGNQKVRDVKKGCLARPQPFFRAEGTGMTRARKNGENAAGSFFQQLHNASSQKPHFEDMANN